MSAEFSIQQGTGDYSSRTAITVLVSEGGTDCKGRLARSCPLFGTESTPDGPPATQIYWRAAAFLLERRHKKDWGRHETIDATVTSQLDAELERRLLKGREANARGDTL